MKHLGAQWRGWILIPTLLLGCRADDHVAVDPDLAKAIDWYTGAAGRVDNELARDLLLRAVSDGDAISRMWLARVYSRGRMTFEENIDSARAIAATVIDDVEKAADRGVVEAIFLVGTAFAEGLGRDHNDIAAAEWYRKAAELGNVLAQHNMGNIYSSGTGVPQSDSLAVVWWTMAAEQGDAIPQFRLGTMYEAGRGVARDLDAARHWYRASADRGNRDALEALARLTN